MCGGSSSSYASTSTSDENCEDVHFKEKLSSPQPRGMTEVEEGEILAIDLVEGSVKAVTEGGLIVGSITGPETANLKDCLRNGHEYEAEVVSKEGGSCEVVVTYDR